MEFHKNHKFHSRPGRRPAPVPCELSGPADAAGGGRPAAGAGLSPVPPAVQAACFDKPSARLAERAAGLMNLPAEQAEGITAGEHMIVGGDCLLLAAEAGISPQFDSVGYYAAVDAAPREPGEYIATARILAHPVKRERVLWLEGAQPRPAPHMSYRPSDANLGGVLGPFVVANLTRRWLIAAARRLSRWAASQIQARGDVQVELLALLNLLVHASARTIHRWDGRVLPVGCLQLLVIGPSGVYKSTLTTGLAKRIGFGSCRSCASACRPAPTA